MLRLLLLLLLQTAASARPPGSNYSGELTHSGRLTGWQWRGRRALRRSQRRGEDGKEGPRDGRRATGSRRRRRRRRRRLRRQLRRRRRRRRQRKLSPVGRRRMRACVRACWTIMHASRRQWTGSDRRHSPLDQHPNSAQFSICRQLRNASLIIFVRLDVGSVRRSWRGTRHLTALAVRTNEQTAVSNCRSIPARHVIAVSLICRRRNAVEIISVKSTGATA